MSARLPHFAAQSVFACFHNVFVGVCVCICWCCLSTRRIANRFLVMSAHNGSGNNQLEKSTATTKYAMYGQDMLTTCMANILCDCKQPKRISSKLYYSNLSSHGTGKYWKSVRANILCTRFPWTRHFRAGAAAPLACVGALRPFAASMAEAIAPAAVDKSGRLRYICALPLSEPDHFKSA